MSFYGKKFKKVRMENVEEFMEKMNVPESIRLLVKNMNSISIFNKNDDGTIQFVVSNDGKESFNQKIVPGGDVDFKTPDGKTAKVHFEVKGDTIESRVTFDDGRKLHMDRVFEGNTMKQIAYKDGVDLKCTTYYETV
ncbi:uncharacterized protein [Choristoneura fumiferana]|uniref:uncharacterized protein n=1 Tax=Choristoneura fumiferana TaxID=7141 RepID=UPI003D158891